MAEQQVAALAGSPLPAESRAARTLREIFQSGRPLTYVRSSEEQRVGRILREVGRRMLDAAPVPVWTWTITEGLQREDGSTLENTQAPRAVLDFIVAHREQGIFHLQDFHEALRDSAEVRRRVRDLYAAARGTGKYVVISAPVQAIPEEVERSMVYLEIRPPDEVELVDFLRDEAPGTDEALLHQLGRALLGLTLDEVQYALRRATSVNSRLSAESLPVLLEEKRLLVNRSGTVEFISTPTDMGDVGGLEGLKKWLRERQKLFEMRDTLGSEIVPKGVLVMGIPGCGKSLCVKAMAAHFRLPLYRIDMVEIFSGRHGKPELAFVQACRMLEDVSPAVLWFDEIEMGITSAESGGEQGRIFAFFLTWMQEKPRGLFVAATANRVDLLPAEMLRKGRFDEVFFVDLPLEEERMEIFALHLKRRAYDPSRFDIAQIMQFTTGWTGAEVEQCVVSAVTKAKLADRELTQQDLITVAAGIVPLSRTMKEQIAHIRNWAFERAVRASPKQIGGR
jgi:SpoVK/Ycf46/Vps4 family AAA+-type ATPase